MQEYWSGLPIPSPGDLPDPRIEPGSPTLQADSLPAKPPGKSLVVKSAVLTIRHHTRSLGQVMLKKPETPDGEF